jgi:hypothetical protein
MAKKIKSLKKNTPKLKSLEIFIDDDIDTFAVENEKKHSIFSRSDESYERSYEFYQNGYERGEYENRSLSFFGHHDLALPESVDPSEIRETSFVEILEREFPQLNPQKAFERILVQISGGEWLFDELAEKWYLETLHSSGYLDKVLHPAYQRIIGLGKDVIPFILRELQDEPSEWFWALRALTGEDPTTEDMAGNREKLAKAWLNWGKENGYI